MVLPTLPDASRFFPIPSCRASTLRRGCAFVLMMGVALGALLPDASAAVLPGRKPVHLLQQAPAAPPGKTKDAAAPSVPPAPAAATTTAPVQATRTQPIASQTGASQTGASVSMLQFGLYQREGEAWADWGMLTRKVPTLVSDITPMIVLIDPQRPDAGYALRGMVPAGGDAVSLCRRVIGAGFGCLAMEKAQSGTVTAAAPAAPASPPAATEQTPVAQAPTPQAPPPAATAKPVAVAVTAPPSPSEVVKAAGSDAVKPAPVLPSAPSLSDIGAGTPNTMQAAAVALAKVVPLSTEPVVKADGVVHYSAEEAKVLNEIEQRSRRTGRLGGVLPDTRLKVTHAVLEREKWNLCAVTFDDGPHRTVTRQILDILRQEKITVTYFPVAKVAARYPEIIQDFVADGHEIGNHSLTHADLRALPPTAQRFEIAEANRILRSIGADPVLFRPPYGRYTNEMLAITREENMSPVLWNVDTRDWQVRDPDKIVHHVKTAAGTGSVILLHSTYASTAAALPRVIAELRAKGCNFVTLSEWITSMKALAEPMMVNATPNTTSRQ